MQYLNDKNQIEFTNEDIKKLTLICDKFKKGVALEKLGYYITLTSDDIWIKIVTQFCVMGSALFFERLDNVDGKFKDFCNDISLTSIFKSTAQNEYIAGVLRFYKATRFYNQQANKLYSLLSNQSVIKNGKVVLIDGLSYEQGFDQIRDELIKRNPFFKMKSASDFMIGLGFSHDVMALDLRVVGFLNKHLDFNVKVSKVQGSPVLYKLLEDSLRLECKKLQVEPAVLDRIIFRNYGKAIDDLLI